MRIGVESWIIQDGNYPDFVIGQTYSFALEFHPRSWTMVTPSAISCAHIKQCQYAVTAQIIGRKSEFAAIDFGEQAYVTGYDLPDVGAWIQGEIYLGVDHFSYFESWKGQTGIPALTRLWRVDRIFLETTPFIETAPRTLERDSSRFSEVERLQTDAWNDDEGRGAYALECTRAGYA